MTRIINEEYSRNPFDPPSIQGPEGPVVPQNDPPEGVVRQSSLGAAFSRENIVGAEIDRQRFEKNLVRAQAQADISEPFDLAEHIPEHHAPYVQAYLDNAVDAESAELIRQRIDQQLDDDLVLNTSGMEGVALRMFASIADPTSIPAIPLTMMSKIGTLGKVVLGSSVVGGSVAAQEALLQHTQDTRTIEETNIAVGAGFLIGGFLGPILSKNTVLTQEAMQDLRSALRGQKKTYTVGISPTGPVKISINPDSFRAKFGPMICP